MKKYVSSILAGTMIVGSLFGGTASAETTKSAENVSKSESKAAGTSHLTDLTGHWVSEKANLWNTRGVIQGTENAKFEPDRGLTRAEWVTFVNRMFQYHESKSSVVFSDVKTTDWFAKEVQVAATAGYINGYEDTTFKPNALLSREEAAVMISRILSLKGENKESAYEDDTVISSWAREAIGAVSKKGIIEGFQDGSFKPAKDITRAEAVSLLDRAFNSFGTWYDEATTYGPKTGKDTLEGSVILNQAGATLQNVDIAGDLIITKAVGDGDIHLKNVTVRGKTYVYGGGEHSVHLEDSVLLTVIVNKLDGTVRLVATGKTSVQEITIQTSANVEAEKGTSINKLTLSNELPEKSRVMIHGEFDTVNIEAKSIFVQIPSGNINQLNVGKGAEGMTLETSKELSILSLVLNAAAKVLGEGNIDRAVVNSSGITMEQKPKNVTLGSDVPSDVKVNIGGSDKVVSVPQESSGSAGGSSGGSGGSSGDGNSGGNNGNNNGGSKNDGAIEGGSWYYLGLASETVTVGESVYVTSTRNGTVYLFKNSGLNVSDKVMLEAGIQAGLVRKESIKSGVRTNVDTSGFYFNGQYGYGVVVFDEKEIPSYHRQLTILDDQTKALISEPNIITVGAAQQYIEFGYNRDIILAEGKDLRTSVTVATYNQPFVPLSADDDVKIERNKIIITPKVPYGRKYKLAIAQNSITTIDKQYFNKSYVTPYTMNSIAKIEMISPSYTYNMKVKIGTKLRFKTERDDTVYFVLTSTVGYPKDFDKEVSDGHGRKIIVPENGTNEIYEVDTSSLPVGEYRLFPWEGYSLYVQLIE
ncbi:hypothetical protein BC351_36685 [Paenibacillus ferrarius]|uniref:SLH domain-containing protein n=1 Tax=Paenibacillus ferrarius TaxID=1469647 RepID=A0A1V4HBB4_9BACL|nr:S-layer homology domain-containing protein [Paenibacillus ferrarius]OPH49656.1 hypothetical protein BC351_36685 [Paenibacillus ferrarius]